MAMEDESLLSDTDRPNLFALVGVLFAGASLALLGCSCNPLMGPLFIPVGGILSSMGLILTRAGLSVASHTGRGGELAQWGVYLGTFTFLCWSTFGLAMLGIVLAVSVGSL